VWFSDPDGRESGGIFGGPAGAQIETIVEGVAALLAIAVGLVPAAGPAVATGLGVLILILLIAEAVSNASSVQVPGQEPGGVFSGSLAAQPAFSSSAAASPGTVATVCAPVSLSSVGRPCWIPVLVLLLQVFLGMIILRRRRPLPGGKRC
jgi:hypothetical protein